MSFTIHDNIQALMFDMDGTLVDTEPVGPITFVEQLASHDVKPTQDDEQLFLKVWRRDGTDVHEEEFLAGIVKNYNIDIEPGAYIQQFFEFYERNLTQALALPGASEFLTSASTGKRFKMALVTASKRSQVEAVLKHQGWVGKFDALVCEEDIQHHKPDPEPFLVGLKKLGVRSEAAVVFEDSKNGALAGKAAQCTVVGLRAGNRDQQDLSAADVVVENFNDVKLLPQDDKTPHE